MTPPEESTGGRPPAAAAAASGRPGIDQLRHAPASRSTILEVGVRAVFHTVLLASLYLLTVGHNSPGGGFVGGLVAGSALVLRYAAGGLDEVKAIFPVRPQLLLGLGLVLATLSGASGWIGGREFMESAKLHVDLPLFGGIHATSALPFDVGVYLVVTGLVLTLLTTMGAPADEELPDGTDPR